MISSQARNLTASGRVPNTSITFFIRELLIVEPVDEVEMVVFPASEQIVVVAGHTDAAVFISGDIVGRGILREGAVDKRDFVFESDSVEALHPGLIGVVGECEEGIYFVGVDAAFALLPDVMSFFEAVIVVEVQLYDWQRITPPLNCIRDIQFPACAQDWCTLVFLLPDIGRDVPGR